MSTALIRFTKRSRCDRRRRCRAASPASGGFGGTCVDELGADAHGLGGEASWIQGGWFRWERAAFGILGAWAGAWDGGRLPAEGHRQSDSDADRETRARRRDQGRRAAARYARVASRRSGR